MAYPQKGSCDGGRAGPRARSDRQKKIDRAGRLLRAFEVEVLEKCAKGLVASLNLSNEVRKRREEGKAPTLQ